MYKNILRKQARSTIGSSVINRGTSMIDGVAITIIGKLRADTLNFFQFIKSNISSSNFFFGECSTYSALGDGGGGETKKKN
jgi:hypothetical protein